MRTRITILGLIVIVTCISAQTTMPTITFNVPLQISSLHQNIQEVQVLCRCYDQTPIPVAEGYSPIITPDANGNINLTTTVTATSMQGRDVASAKTYTCTLRLKQAGATTFTTPSNISGLPIEMQPKPGTTFVNQVTGSITW